MRFQLLKFFVTKTRKTECKIPWFLYDDGYDAHHSFFIMAFLAKLKRWKMQSTNHIICIVFRSSLCKFEIFLWRFCDWFSWQHCFCRKILCNNRVRVISKSIKINQCFFVGFLIGIRLIFFCFWVFIRSLLEYKYIHR